MNTPSAANGKGGGENQVAKNLNVDPVFDAENIALQRRMRFNPLRALDPENLSIALDQFEIGILRQAAMLWEAMCKRDDTLVTVKPQLENSVASKAWGVFKKKGADEKEAARHAAALEYFYEHASATDAFDRNERGGRERLIAQMMRADSFNYAVHHFVWRPQPGKMIDVEGAAPVPALSAELEYVPLWYFENTTGTLRFLPYGGFGVIGDAMDFENEWMVTTGRGLMFAAAICYVFKRLTFQDWTIFNERYAQNKVVGMTNATKESSQGQALLQVIADFNGDQGIAFFECGNTDKPPISLLGPSGATSPEIFEKFIERQDRKIASMFRGNDLSMMSRGGKGERAAGASLQKDEGDAMERGACKMIAGALHEGIDRKVIRYCFGEDVEPLAYFGLPDMDVENTKDLRESAGFLADRGAKVSIEAVADRLGVQLSTEDEEALQPVQSGANTESLPVETQTANAQIESEAVALLRTVEDALRTANGEDDIEKWITVGGQHIPIHKGETAEEAIKNHQKSSQNSEKNGNLKEQNERPSPTHTEDAEDSGGRPGIAEKATRDELQRVESADQAAGHPEHDVEGKYNRQVEALRSLREREPSLATEPNPPAEIYRGAEHIVEHSEEEPSRVLKHTYDSGQNPDVRAHFGYRVDSQYDLVGTGGYKGSLVLRPATPLEYTERISDQNNVFGSDLKIAGIHNHEGNIGLTVSQRALKGAEPTHDEMESLLRSKGYERVSADKISTTHIADKTWYNPKDRTLVSDVKPDNFKKDAEGHLHAIDLMVQRLPRGSDLHDILTK